MRIIDKIDTNFKTTKELRDLFKNEQLKVDNSFQRKYVWEEKQQIQLIETMLLGYDIPELYFWQYDTDPETGNAKYSIVDGQQRIGSIIDFINNKFPLKKSKLLEKNMSYEDKFFNELDKEDKINFWNYKFTVKIIDSSLSVENIITLFLRLNISNKCLNPQELRNAQYNGKFLKLAIELADLNFWEKYHIFSNNDVRRMIDVEFVSNLLMFLRKGIKVQYTQKALNEIYDQYNNQYFEENKDKRELIEIIELMEKLFEFDKENVDLYKKQTHFYSIFVTIYALKREGELSEDIFKKIKKFYDIYKSDYESNDFVKEYYNNSQDAVRSQAKREGRFRALYNFINEKMS